MKIFSPERPAFAQDSWLLNEAGVGALMPCTQNSTYNIWFPKTLLIAHC